MGTLFFTGFPGFLGTELLPRILSRDAGARAACLVQKKFADLARQRVGELTGAQPGLTGRIGILEGDLTEPGLGVAPDVKQNISEIYHVAAIYDLSVGRAAAMRVNVEGTRNMLAFASECPQLERFHYVSTCYVSGTYSGVFSETDLDLGQRFLNFYEETKFLAEVEVQKAMRAGLPATIYRPAIVVGDSKSGATQKYDGPYGLFRLLLRQRRVAIMPIIGDPGKTEVNVVPRDFVVEAMTYLSGLPGSRGCVYHLADPDPLTVEQLLEELGRVTGRKMIRVPLPLGLAKTSLRHVPGMSRLIGISPDALDYFVHPCHYAAERTAAVLQSGGIRCPRFPAYARRLIDFVIAHPEIGAAAMA
jgi:thioester reductase-like protein